jgi:hypothetical protein
LGHRGRRRPLFQYGPGPSHVRTGLGRANHGTKAAARDRRVDAGARRQ